MCLPCLWLGYLRILGKSSGSVLTHPPGLKCGTSKPRTDVDVPRRPSPVGTWLVIASKDSAQIHGSISLEPKKGPQKTFQRESVRAVLKCLNKQTQEGTYYLVLTKLP